MRGGDTRNGSTEPRILNLYTRRSATHLGCFTTGERVSPPHPSERRLCGHKEPVWALWRKDNLLPQPGHEPQFLGSLSRSPVTIPSALFTETKTTVNTNFLFSLYKHHGDKQKPPTTLVRLTLFTIIYITVYIIKTENKKRHFFTCNIPIVMRFLAFDVNNINKNVHVKYM
jgi:hypothetical protein